MKIDCGFWDKDGNYKKDIQEVEMLSVEQINLLQGQNEGLKKQNAELQRENAELKAENDRLKEEIKEVKKYQYEQEFLEKEIETAKVNLDIGKEEAKHYLHEAYKFQKCLQEIKAIAETPKPFIDFSETKTATEVEYDYAAICNELELRLHKVLELITKAEEE